MAAGLTSQTLGQPDYALAVTQHEAYVAALCGLGLEVTILVADNEYPDSVFVEDVALLTPACAVITRPGAESRRGEIKAMTTVLEKRFTVVEHIDSPGTLDAGDIMMVGSHFYIGLSERTNPDGAQQMISILRRHRLTGSTVPLTAMLHLKSGVACLENNVLVVAGEMRDNPAFAEFDWIAVDDDEAYAANCLWINGTVLVASGFPSVKRAIENRGFPTIALEMSEFRKLDGGLSCLSLRY